MTPRILFVGCGQGSWQIRGQQIGAALGARCTTAPTPDDWRWADVAILVKRAIDQWGYHAKEAGIPLIWDALDFWRQPDENRFTQAQVIADVVRRKERYQLAAVIGATQAMATMIRGVYIPHHSRPGLVPTPIRDRVKVVAYEGTQKYLGSWRARLEQACAARGVTFTVNPISLATADLVVAFRGEQWDGWPCRWWKSGVKIGNAIAAGRPIVSQRSAAFTELEPVGCLVETPEELEDALDQLIDLTWIREAAYAAGHARGPEFSLSTIANGYRLLIRSVLERAA